MISTKFENCMQFFLFGDEYLVQKKFCGSNTYDVYEHKDDCSNYLCTVRADNYEDAFELYLKEFTHGLLNSIEGQS